MRNRPLAETKIFLNAIKPQLFLRSVFSDDAGRPEAIQRNVCVPSNANGPLNAIKYIGCCLGASSRYEDDD